MDAIDSQIQPSDTASVGGLAALLAFAGSVAIIAWTAWGPGRQPPDIPSVVAPGLWVLGVLTLALGGRATRRPLVLLAVATYAGAFLLPAAVSRSSAIPGYVAFFAGWIVVPVAWLANPAVVIGLVHHRRAQPGRAVVAYIAAMGLALTTLTMAWNGSSPGPGYWLWAAAPLLLAFDCALQPTWPDYSSGSPAPSVSHAKRTERETSASNPLRARIA